MKDALSPTHETLTEPPLRRDLTVDVAIIGGGMVGLLSAYILASEGKRIAIVEANRLLSGVTSLTTAFITQVIDTDFSDLLEIYGTTKAKLIWESHGKAIDLIEHIATIEGIECSFGHCDNYTYANSQADFRSLETEYGAMQKLGFNVSLQKKGKLGFTQYGYLTVANQAKFEAMAFLQKLIPILKAKGVQIFEQTTALGIEGDTPVIVKTAEHSIRAEYVVNATYDPLGNPKETFMKKGMYVSYVFEVHIPKGIIPEGLYEDTANPYHYFRIDPKDTFDRMIIGGEDNRREIAFGEQKNFNALHAYLRHLLPNISYTVHSQWKGPILEPSDGLALIGEYEPHRLIATAFSGNGMTYSAIAAMTFRDIITCKPLAWDVLYNPTRPLRPKPVLRKARDYIEEFFGGAARNTLRFWLTNKKQDNSLRHE